MNRFYYLVLALFIAAFFGYSIAYFEKDRIFVSDIFPTHRYVYDSEWRQERDDSFYQNYGTLLQDARHAAGLIGATGGMAIVLISVGAVIGVRRRRHRLQVTRSKPN